MSVTEPRDHEGYLCSVIYNIALQPIEGLNGMVRVIGLEPTRPKAPEPKSGAHQFRHTRSQKQLIAIIIKNKIKKYTLIIF